MFTVLSASISHLGRCSSLGVVNVVVVVASFAVHECNVRRCVMPPLVNVYVKHYGPPEAKVESSIPRPSSSLPFSAIRFHFIVTGCPFCFWFCFQFPHYMRCFFSFSPSLSRSLSLFYYLFLLNPPWRKNNGYLSREWVALIIMILQMFANYFFFHSGLILTLFSHIFTFIPWIA